MEAVYAGAGIGRMVDLSRSASFGRRSPRVDHDLLGLSPLMREPFGITLRNTVRGSTSSMLGS
jgi:hypothetical protein